MKPYFILLIVTNTSVACNNISTVSQRKQEIVTDTTFEVPPPSMSILKTPSQTLEKWFNRLCDTTLESSEAIIYQFGFFEMTNQDYYALYLFDLEKYKRGGRGESPTIKYFLIDRVPYKGLDWHKVLELMRKQLLELSKNEKFKSSSISKAKSITIRFDDLELLKLK